MMFEQPDHRLEVPAAGQPDRSDALLRVFHPDPNFVEMAFGLEALVGEGVSGLIALLQALD